MARPAAYAGHDERDDHPGRRGCQERRLAEPHQPPLERQVHGAGGAEHAHLQPGDHQQAGQGEHEAGYRQPRVQGRVDRPDEHADRERGQDREQQRPAQLDGADGDDGGGQPGDGPDRQVDLPDVQREHHAERDHPGRGGLLREVDQVVRGQEVRVEHLEHEPDEHEDHGDGQHAEVARAQALPGGDAAEADGRSSLRSPSRPPAALRSWSWRRRTPRWCGRAAGRRYGRRRPARRPASGWSAGRRARARAAARPG